MQVFFFSFMAEEITSQLKKNLLDEENGTSSHVVEGAADADADAELSPPSQKGDDTKGTNSFSIYRYVPHI